MALDCSFCIVLDRIRSNIALLSQSGSLSVKYACLSLNSRSYLLPHRPRKICSMAHLSGRRFDQDCWPIKHSAWISDIPVQACSSFMIWASFSISGPRILKSLLNTSPTSFIRFVIATVSLSNILSPSISLACLLNLSPLKQGLVSLLTYL